MSKTFVLATLLAAAIAGGASAQNRSSGDRALGAELNRDRAETRIDRLRQDQRQKEDRPGAARAQKIQPSGGSTQPPPR